MPGQMRSTIEKKMIKLRAVAEAALRDLLAQPHHEDRARRQEERHLQLEAEARRRHRALQRLREQREAPRLRPRRGTPWRSASTG